MTSNVLFIDRDGTLIMEPADHQVDALDKIQLVANVIPSLLEISRHGYRFVMVSNQDGLGTDSYPQSQFDMCQLHTLQLFESQGIHFDEIFICPHLPDDGCDCRKPAPGLLEQLAPPSGVSMRDVPVIGDSARDLQSAAAVGARPLLVLTGNGRKTLAALVAVGKEVETYDDLASAAYALVSETA